MDQLDHLARRAGAGGRVLRRGAGEPAGVRARPPTRTSAPPTTRTTRPTTTSSRTGRRRPRSASTVAPTSSARRTRTGPRPGTRSRELTVETPRAPRDRAAPPVTPVSDRRRRDRTRRCARRPRLRSASVGRRRARCWLLVVYLGSLAALLITSLYRLADDPTGLVTKLDTAARQLSTGSSTNPSIAGRAPDDRPRPPSRSSTRDRAAGRVLHGARSRRRGRARGLVVGVTMPLWAGYLVKGYAWRAMLDPAAASLKEVFGHSPGFGTRARSRAVLPLVAVHGDPDLRRASSACRTRCSKRRPTSAPRPAARSAAWCCRCWCRRSSRDRSSRSR